MTRFVRVKIHSYSLSVCSVELRRNDEIVRVSVSVSVCPNYALNNQWQSDIVIVCQFVLLKCSVRQSVTKSVCMSWRDHDVKKKGGLTIRPTWPKEQDTTPPINHDFRSFCHFSWHEFVSLFVLLRVFVVQFHVDHSLLSSVGLREWRKKEKEENKREE